VRFSNERALWTRSSRKLTHPHLNWAKILSRPSNRSDQNEWFSHLLAYTYAAHFFFGSVTVLNALGLEFFFYYPRTIKIAILAPSLDVLAWTVSVICLSALTIISSKGRESRVVQVGLGLLAIILSVALLMTLNSGPPNRTGVYLLFTVAGAGFIARIAAQHRRFSQQSIALISRVLIYLLVFFAVIETSTVTHYVLRAFDQTTQVGGMDATIELQFSYASYPLLPWLYVGFLFSWAWVPLVWKFIGKSSSQRNLSGKNSNYETSLLRLSSEKWINVLLDPRLPLVLAVVVFVGYYPYFQNPPWLVGTDAFWRYHDPLMVVNSKGVSGGFVQALDERHPAPLILLYTVQLVFQTTAFEVVKFSPLFLVVALGLAMWWFLARKRTLDFGLVVFLLSVLSVTTTVGMYSSILANWMALLVWVFFFAYVSYRGDEGFRPLDLVILLTLSTLILVIHPWTWGVFATAATLAALFTLIKDKRKGFRSSGIVLAAILLSVLFGYMSLTFLAQSQGWRVADALEYYTFVLTNPSSVLYFWDALTRLTEIWSPFYSPLYLAISILGVLSLNKLNLSPWRLRLVLAWILASAIGSVLVAPVGYDPADRAGSETQLWRLLFLTPFQITAPFGIAWLTQLPYHLQKIGSDSGFEVKGEARSIHLFWLAAVFVIGVLLASVPVSTRPLLVLLVLPLVTWLFLSKARSAESRFLYGILVVTLLLVAASNTCRALSQLLIDPHNYIP